MDSKGLIKDKILRSAIQLMNQFGYGSVTLSELARVSKITKQRLYYHFKDSEEIIMQLAQVWGHSGQEFSLNALAETNEVGAYKVLAMNKGLFAWVEHDFELARLGLVLFQTSHQLKDLNKLMTIVRNKGRERIHSFLLQEKVFQKMKASQLEDIVTSLHSQMYGTYFYTISMNDIKKVDQHRKNSEETLRKIIDVYLK